MNTQLPSLPPVLVVHNVSKAFRKFDSVAHRMANWLFGAERGLNSVEVIKSISLNVLPGEVVAIIGQNGAGKSTLLKLITGVIQPNSGGVHYLGRVAAILELGLGFNPEFTGRQNVFSSASVMGFKDDEISSMMPEIEEFAEIGEYIDRPVKTYSSGMMARLAFSVATAARPDLLIIDEVLSVGDTYFQHKSFDRIRQFKEQGTAILFVSHSMGDVKALCDRVALLDSGVIAKLGLADEVVDYYNALIAAKENGKLSIEQRREKGGWLYSRSGTFDAVITSLTLLDSDTREEVKCARVGQKLVLELVAEAKTSLPRLVLGHMFRDKTGHVVWGTNTWHTSQVLENIQKGSRIKYAMFFSCDLGPGSYSVSPALVSTDTHLVDNYEWQDNALVFDVINADHAIFIGTSHIKSEFKINIEGS